MLPLFFISFFFSLVLSDHIPAERDPCLPRSYGERAQKCKMFVGDVFELVGHSKRIPDTILSVGERGVSMLESGDFGDQVLFQRFVFQDDYVSIEQLGAMPRDSAYCAAGQLAQYDYSWNDDCSEICLNLQYRSSPTCEAAPQLLTFKRKKCERFFAAERKTPLGCRMRPFGVYFGAYTETGEWASLVLGHSSFVYSSSGNDNHVFGKFSQERGEMHFVDVGSVPQGEQCVGDNVLARRVGQYKLHFHDRKCARFTLEEVKDRCGARFVRFADLQMERVNSCNDGLPTMCIRCNDSDDDDDSVSFAPEKSRNHCLDTSTELSALGGKENDDDDV